mgnify:FL=1
MSELESLLGDVTKNTANEERVNTLEGTLWPSDDAIKGNLMLVNSATTIYIKSSRDFGSLVGKYVIASVDGTLDNFVLLNIEEHLTKDGFIRTP